MRVLLIDDDKTVRDGLSRALQREGFEVTEASNGVTAWRELREGSFAAIVCDIMMPMLNGVRFFLDLSAELPEAARRVVFISGYTEDPEIREFLQHCGRPALTKPFDLADLRRLVQEVARQPS